MPSIKPGGAAQLYYRSAGSWSSPTHTAVKIRDLKWSDMPSGMFDAGDRTSEFEAQIPTRTKLKIEFEFLHDSSDTAKMAIVAAATSGRATPFELLATDDDKATSGTRGIRFEAAFESGFDNDAKLADGQLLKFVAVPHGNASNAPVRWLTA